MNVFQIEPPDGDAARQIARQLYASICGEHDWGQFFAAEPKHDLLDALATLPPREMRRALLTGFGNARLDGRDELRPDDLPKAGTARSRIGFTQ